MILAPIFSLKKIVRSLTSRKLYWKVKLTHYLFIVYGLTRFRFRFYEVGDRLDISQMPHNDTEVKYSFKNSLEVSLGLVKLYTA